MGHLRFYETFHKGLCVSHANTPCKILKKSPAQLAFGRCLKDFFPRNVKSLLPIPDNLMTGEVKDKLQGKIREDGAKRWSEHTRVLPDLRCLVRWLDIHTCPRLYAWPQLFSSYNNADLCSALRLSSALTIFK